MIIQTISNYLDTLRQKGVPVELFKRNSILLAGSVGWGVKNDTDPHTDLDLHVILSESDYQQFVKQCGADYVIDDHAHKPSIFAQIRSSRWLKARFEAADRRWWPMYLWIYKYGKWVCQSADVRQLFEEASVRFDQELLDLVRDHFVLFCARKNGVRSSAQQGLLVEADLYQSECVRLALQLACLIGREPYPYDKWLPRFAGKIGGLDVLEGLPQSMVSWEERQGYLSKTEKNLIQAITDAWGGLPWLRTWWKYNEN